MRMVPIDDDLLLDRRSCGQNLTSGNMAEAMAMYCKLPLSSEDVVVDELDEEDDKLLTVAAERPPSSAGSDDSGCYNSDVSDEENASSCIADSGTSWLKAATLTTPSYLTRDVTPTRHEIVSAIMPTVSDICYYCSTLLTDDVISVDLTDRSDVTYSIESLHYPALPASAASSTGSDVSSQPSDIDQDECLSRKSFSESECSDDVELVEPCETTTSGPRPLGDVYVPTSDVVAPMVSEKKYFKQRVVGCSRDNNINRNPRRHRQAGAALWRHSALVTSLVPGCLIITPPIVGYIVLKPVGCSNMPSCSGDYYRMPSAPAVQLCSSGIQGTPVMVIPNALNSGNYNTPTKQSFMCNRTPASRHWFNYAHSSKQKYKVSLRVMTYNVLAKKMATTERFRYCPDRMLSWDYRKSLILNEIMTREADVIALQEVESSEYMNFFQPRLAELGYNGVFALKSRARTMSAHDQLDVDGCAIFYKTNKFAVVSTHVIEFNSLALHATVGLELEQNHDFLHRVLSKDNVGLAVLLQTTRGAWNDDVPISVSEPILVATAHLFWHPQFADVKLIQTMLLTHELRRIMATVPKHLRPLNSAEQHVPMILAGDFNALPDSGVVSFLRRGSIDSTHPDFYGRDYISCLRKLNDVSFACDDVTDTSSVCYKHGFQLEVVDCRAAFTNYTTWFRGVIDHVFYTSNVNIRPVRALQGLSTDWLRRHDVIGLPTSDIPSDHITLVVDFELTSSHSASRPTTSSDV